MDKTAVPLDNSALNALNDLVRVFCRRPWPLEIGKRWMWYRLELGTPREIIVNAVHRHDGQEDLARRELGHVVANLRRAAGRGKWKPWQRHRHNLEGALSLLKQRAKEMNY